MIRNLCKMAMICTMLSYISCTKDYVEKPVEKTRAVPVSLFLASQDDTANETRAGEISPDCEVKTMDMLIFDESDRFLKRVQVLEALLRQTATGVSFTADLEITNKKRTIHFIANGRSTSGQDRLNFDEVTPNMPMSEVFKKLRTKSLPNEGQETGTTMAQHVMPLVMWSQKVLNGITPNTSIRDLKLLRAAAAVQVKVSNTVRDFTLNQITVHNGVTSGFVAPANIASVETPTTPNPITTSSYMHYKRGWVSGTTPTLYVYERNCTSSNYMSVLVEGTYKGTRGYYKIVLKSGSTWYNVVRNHRYIVTIAAVDAPGYASVNDAISAPPSNDRLTVTINDEASEFPFIAADGQYYMGLTNSQVTVYKQIEATVELCKVYSSNDKQPTVTGVASSLVKNIRVAKEKTNVYKVSATIAHPSNAVETTTATITCGNLSLPLKITGNKNVVGGDADIDSYVLDLLESSDRNWMVDIKTNTAYMKLSGTLSSAGDYPGKESEMTNSLSDKYWRKAYLHVKTSMSSEGTLFMTGSNASSEPFARKIIVHHNR